MTFVRKFNGRTEESNNTPIVATYTCPDHGEMDVEVRRDERGEAPDTIACPSAAETCPACNGTPDRPEFCGGCDLCFGRKVIWCPFDATWTPSPSVACRVRRVEVVRGKWEKPERKTYLDTRELGEGMSMEEFRAKRERIWDERRREEVKELLRG